MTIKVKICGIDSINAMQAAIMAKADFAGFVFVPSSPRFISPEKAAIIADKCPKRVKKVALFVNPEKTFLEETLKKFRVDYIQLHGTETPETIETIRLDFGVPIIKSVSISSYEDLEKAKSFYEVADIILFDAKAPKDSKMAGGNGITFDWNIIKGNVPKKIRWFLAGGLNPQNVKEAILKTGAKYVDVSTGVEESLSVKSPELIFEFIKKAKQNL